jgi:hypothetical protein
MPRKYTKEEIIEKCEAAIKLPQNFYNYGFINYTGTVKGGNELYSEVIAEYLLDHIDEFKSGISIIERKGNYCIKTHNGEHEKTNREEEGIAMDMFNRSKEEKGFHIIGEIIDYQTPLNDKKTDGAGKIDLLSYNKENNQMYILELKKQDSNETMLRCVLEGYTYSKIVDKEKLLSDFEIDVNAELCACPFVFKGGNQEKEMKEGRPKLEKLMEALNSKPLYITQEVKYSIQE